MRTLSSCLLISAFLAAGEPTEVPEYLYKSILLKKVSDFVEWPSSDPSRPFVIGVLGKNPFGDYLGSVYASRSIKGRRVRMVSLTGPEEAGKVDLLFISASEKPRLQAILAAIGNQEILTIGDTEGYAQAGVMVNVRMREGSPFFELNLRSFQRAHLAVNPYFVRIAKEVLE